MSHVGTEHLARTCAVNGDMTHQYDVSADLRARLESQMPGFVHELDRAIHEGRALGWLADNLASALDFLDTADRRNEVLASEMLIRGLDADPELHVTREDAS